MLEFIAKTLLCVVLGVLVSDTVCGEWQAAVSLCGIGWMLLVERKAG